MTKEIKIITETPLIDVVGLPDTMVYTNEVRPSNYQGWTNYETWRVNLEIFDGVDWAEWYGEDEEAHPFYEFVDSLKEYAEQAVIMDDSVNTLANSYASAFLQEVNYNEIAKHIVEQYPNLGVAND